MHTVVSTVGYIPPAVNAASTQPSQPDTALHFAESAAKASEFIEQRLDSINAFLVSGPQSTTPCAPPRAAGLLGTMEGTLQTLNRMAAIVGEIDRKLGL